MTRALALAPPLHRRTNPPAMTGIWRGKVPRSHRAPKRIVQAGTETPLFFCLCGRLTERERGRCAWCETQGVTAAEGITR